MDSFIDHIKVKSFIELSSINLTSLSFKNLSLIKIILSLRSCMSIPTGFLHRAIALKLLV